MKLYFIYNKKTTDDYNHISLTNTQKRELEFRDGFLNDDPSIIGRLRESECDVGGVDCYSLVI
jgi:hypothetical protein